MGSKESCEEASMQSGTQNEKERKMSFVLSWQKSLTTTDTQRESERASEGGSYVELSVCFGVSCLSATAAGSMELEPQRFSK